MTSTVTFKFLVHENGKPTGDIRRVTLKDPVQLQTLYSAAEDILGWPSGVVFRFRDEDDDEVTIASQHELDTAISLARGAAVRLCVMKPDASPAPAPAEAAPAPVEAAPEAAAAPAPAPVAAAAPAAAAPVNWLDTAPDATIPENVMVQFSAIAEFFQRMAQQMTEFAPRIPVILNEGIRKMSANMQNNFNPLEVSVNAARSVPADAPEPEVPQGVVVHRLPESVVHPGIECAHCHKKPVTGMRYKCVQCDCDLCQDCVFLPGVHTEGHKFLPVCAPAVGSHFVNSASEACQAVKDRAAPVVQNVRAVVEESVANARDKSVEIGEKVKQQVVAAKEAAEKKLSPPAPSADDDLTEKEREMLKQLNDMGFTDQAQLLPLIRKHKEMSRIVEVLIR